MGEKVFMLLASSLAKLSPIGYGLFLSRSYGDAEYSSFVLLINYCAAISAIATMGSSPQILRAEAELDRDKYIARLVVAGCFIIIAVVVVSAFYWKLSDGKYLLSYLGNSKAAETLLITLYCAALFFISTTNAILNQARKWVLTGVNNVLVFGGSILAGTVVGLSGGSANLSLLAYCSALTVISLVTLLFSAGGLLKNGVGTGWKLTDIFLGMYKNIRSSIFGLVTLGGFYYVNYIVNHKASALDAAVYGLGFQMFSITLYLPSVLGAFAVPAIIHNASRRRVNNSIELKIKMVYMGVACSMAAIMFVFHRGIFQVYNIDYAESHVYAFGLMQLAAIAAALNAFYLQRNVASGTFDDINVNAFVWLAVILVGSFTHSIDPLTAAVTFLASYCISTMLYAYRLASKGKEAK